MITCRGREEEEKVTRLAKLLNMDKSEVVRQAINAYYAKYQQEFTAFQWLEPKLEMLPGSGRFDISARNKELLSDIFAARAIARR
jgi:hypothetical protein